jgi:serine/threonine-protein kinase
MKACPACRNTYSDGVAFCPNDGASLSMVNQLQPGLVIRQRFRIDARLGRGGFGEVYRVWHLYLNEPRALKILLRSRFEADQEAKALAAEARVLRQLQHQNIVRVEDVDETEDGRPFVVMEYVVGESLRELLDRERALPVSKALAIAVQTCSALRAAHDKGILHRDIKPENLLIVKGPDGSPNVKVIDFGIAKVREDASISVSGLMTVATGFFLGSAKYCSPEQAQGMRGASLDGRSDLYALGLVLFESLTGTTPFMADSPEEFVDARRTQRPKTLEQVRPDMTFPKRLSKLLVRALERDRNLRFRSAEEMENELRQVWAELLVPAPAPKRDSRPRVPTIVEPVPPPRPPEQRPAQLWMPPPAQSWTPPPQAAMAPPAQPSTQLGMQPTKVWAPPLPAPRGAKPRRVLRWSIVIASILIVLSAAGFFVVQQMWIGYAPGVYVTQPVEKRQRVTADLLKEIGPPPESDPDAPKTIKELGDGTSFFCNALGKRQRIRWADVATDASQCNR